MRLSKLLVLAILIIGYSVPAFAKAYDGIWFLGFNLKSPVFKDLAVRQAADAVIDKEFINKRIVSGEVIPASFIPPSMLGYDPDLQTEPHDLKYAKLLMKKAKFLPTDKRLKTLSLLHTDGLVTIEIAKKVQSDLRQLGIKLNLVQVSYQDEDKWIDELLSGKHDLFLMGYKAGMENLFTSEASVAETDSTSLVEPLFQTGGDANFTGYSNAKVDTWLGQIGQLNPALKEERHKKLKALNQQLAKDLPVVVLFYIETL
jgi:glutathione transport system substrate-binding protein